MDIDLKQLEELMKLCRTNGVAIFEHQDTKLVMDSSFQEPSKSAPEPRKPAPEPEGSPAPYPAEAFGDGKPPEFDY